MALRMLEVLPGIVRSADTAGFATLLGALAIMIWIRPCARIAPLPFLFSMTLLSYSRGFDSTDIGVVAFAASLAAYLTFHKYEPRSMAARVFLVIVAPSCLSLWAVSVLNNFGAGLLTFAAYLILILSFTTLYRLSPFHPLAKYPGPVLHKISKLRTTYVCQQGHLHQYYQKLHQTYGDVVRVGPNELSYCNVDGIWPILGPYGLHKGPYYDDRHPKKPTLVSARDPVDHASRRRAWTRAFNTASLKEYVPLIIRRSRELSGSLSKRTCRTVDLSKWMDYFSFDFMGDMVFNYSFDMMKEGRDVHGFWDTVSDGLRLIAILSHVPWTTKFVCRVINPGGKGTRLHEISSKMISQRVKAGSMTRDLYYHLSYEDTKASGTVDLGQMISDGVNAIVAGSDTTSTVLTTLWYYLLQKPSFYARLREEVDGAFPSHEEPIDLQKLSTLPYLHACINEAMRLQPPVPSGSQRIVPRGSGGRMIGKHFITEGTNIILHPYSLQRDPRYFSPYPEEFWPDRWLAPEHRKSLNDASKPLDPNINVIHDGRAFIPFSAGPRVCVGKNLAMNELRIVVSSVVQRFDMKLAEGYEPAEWVQGLKDFFVMERVNPLPVVLSERFN